MRRKRANGFFDRMRDSVSAAGTEVNQKMSCAAETMKLNNQIRNNDKEIDKLIFQVGKRYVEEHLMDQGDVYEDLLAQIRNYKSQNGAYEEEIQRLNRESEEQTRMRRQEMKEKQEQRERERREKEALKQQRAEAAREQWAEKAREQYTEAAGEQPSEIFKEQKTEGVKEQETAVESGKTCSKCNQVNELDAKFCVYCGTPFAEEESKE